MLNLGIGKGWARNILKNLQKKQPKLRKWLYNFVGLSQNYTLFVVQICYYLCLAKDFQYNFFKY